MKHNEPIRRCLRVNSALRGQESVAHIQAQMPMGERGEDTALFPTTYMVLGCHTWTKQDKQIRAEEETTGEESNSEIKIGVREI